MSVTVRQLREDEVGEADRVCREAFATFVGVDDVFGDADYVRSRWQAGSDRALAALIDGELVGSNFVARWGSVGVLGPLSVRPELWDRGIAKALMAAAVDRFDAWETTHDGLFTFPTSAKHLGLYQRFGFWPAYLTAMLSKPGARTPTPAGSVRFSAATNSAEVLEGCRRVTGTVYDGLDLSSEILAVADLALGDTVVVEGDDGVTGFAVCHHGPGTEAGSGSLYVKFAIVTPGSGATTAFGRLLDACEALGAAASCETILAGVNTARVEAYRVLLDRGFRTQNVGVAMQRGPSAGYNHRDVYAIDDWR